MSMQNGNIAAEESTPVVVVIVPLPAQGHLNQLLHLSRLISSRGIPVHYVGLETHNRQAKNRVQGWDPTPSTKTNLLHFHDFPPFPPELPINLPPAPIPPLCFPTHLLPIFKACHTDHFRKPLSSLLRSLSPTARKLAVIHDTLTSFAAHEASLLPNAESYSFYAAGAFCLFHSTLEFHKQQATISSIDLPNSVSFQDCFPSEFFEFLGSCMELLKLDHGYLCNTCDAIDAKFLSRMGEITEFSNPGRGWAVGPLNPIALIDSSAISINNNNNKQPRDKCLEWLDRQEPDSVIYVSFGTMTSVSNEQITELAIGLERSEQRFIWVLRDADRGDIYAGDDKESKRRIELADGFEQRVSEKGLIIRDWAPQLEILAHAATGGFVSHCGWNSCVESLSLGVPIAAWPMHSDQPWNAILVSEVLKVGLVARGWDKRKELCSWGCVESVVRKLMVSEEGKEVRKRARELSLAVREAISEGGASARELDSFLAHVSRPEE